MTNAVLLFTGNVVSTPTIEYVRSSGNVFVPVVEHFDQHNISQLTEIDENMVAGYLTGVLSDLYSGEIHPYLLNNYLEEWNESIDPGSFDHTFFKWRPFETTIPGAISLAEVFRDNNVRPILIRRASIVEQSLKIALSEMVYGNRHQQFAAAKMSDDEYEDYLNGQRKIRIRIDEDGISSLLKLCREFLGRTRNVIKRRNWYFPTFENGDLVMVTEDFYQPEIVQTRFDDFFRGVFGTEFESRIDAPTRTRKAGLSIENCENYDELIAHPGLQRIEASYSNLEWSRLPMTEVGTQQGGNATRPAARQ